MPAGARRPARPLLGALVALLLSPLVAACDVGGSAEPSERAHPEPDPFVYVALGDSYTAAHGVPGTNWLDGCLQSDRNYPNLVAEELPAATLVDVSCSGAATQHLLNERSYGTIHHPPQFDALTRDVDLVTISIGYNDFRLFATLFGRCAEMAKRDPDGSPCQDRLVRPNGFDYLHKRVEIIGQRVATAVRGIRERSPEARILVISYPHLIPPQGYCRNRLPLAKGDYPYVRGINEAMSEVQRKAAEAVAGAEYVDVTAASVGHDVCSDDPWVAGINPVATRAAAYHPFAVEQRAVADLVLDQL
jgi:lysophospholipase L1-like esterase